MKDEKVYNKYKSIINDAGNPTFTDKYEQLKELEQKLIKKEEKKRAR